MSARTAVRTMGTVLLSVAALVMSVAPVAADTGQPRFERYVALGDSFTAGPLIPPVQLNPVGCGRSGANFASLLARRLNVGAFTDISCSGAKTEHMTSSQPVTLGPNRPQFTALSRDTDLVTISIGANDYPLFGWITAQCPEFLEVDPVGAPCKEHFTNGAGNPTQRMLAEVRGKVADVLRAITERAPDATVLLIGYPRMIPAEGYCQDILPFAKADYAWADSVERGLNDTLADAAGEAGVTYVDTYGPSLGHDACADNGEAWVNGQQGRLLGATPYHPLPAGMRGVAGVIADELNASA